LSGVQRPSRDAIRCENGKTLLILSFKRRGHRGTFQRPGRHRVRNPLLRVIFCVGEHGMFEQTKLEQSKFEQSKFED
jgi:hypothetical protein